jgi:hypothetical protein
MSKYEMSPLAVGFERGYCVLYDLIPEFVTRSEDGWLYREVCILVE